MKRCDEDGDADEEVDRAGGPPAQLALHRGMKASGESFFFLGLRR
jgi:hypothetical protein